MHSLGLKSGLAAGVLVALASLTACSGGDSDKSSSEPALSAGDVGVAEPADGGDAGGSGAAEDKAGANRSVVQTKSVIRTGQVAITADDLEKVRAEVDELLITVDGTLADEQSSNDPKGKVERSTLVLRVPAESFVTTKNALMDLGRKLGKLKTSKSSSKDVTNEVIDVDERVQTLQNSLDNLQRYQRDAKDVADLLDFEEKITTRQAELQSLKAQQTYLRDQTSMSTITLYLSTPDKYVAPPDALEDAGFLSGLEAGWHALGDVVVVTLTVLGALLPFLVAAVILGVPTWIGIRALLRRRRTEVALPDSP